MIDLASKGTPQEDIARLLGMDAKTLRKVYCGELRQGMGMSNQAVAGKLFERCMAGDTACLIFWAKTRMGWSEKASFIGREILEKYQAGEVTLKDAALEFEIAGLPLPETIRLLLAKEQPEPEDTTGGVYRIISDEEMAIRIEQRKKVIEEQIQGLPERQQDMRALREQVKETFAPVADSKGAK